MKFIYMAILLIFSTTGLIATARGGGGAASSDPLAAYVVPVPATLAKYALFTNVRVDIKAMGTGQTSFKYRIPVELTGVENKVEFFGTPDSAGKMEATGENGSALCDGGAKVGSCELFYKNLQFDHDLRDQILTRISSGDADQLAARQAVADQFEKSVLEKSMGAMQPAIQRGGGEPHGVLEIIY